MKYLNKTSILFSNQGMSMIEVMVVVTVMSIVGMGTATMVTKMTASQNRSNLKIALFQIQSNLEEAIKNDNAWSLTVNDAANNAIVGCMADGNTCADGYTNATDFRIYDAAGNVEYDGLNPAAGWTFEGQTCVGWSAAGNDACPFRYNTTVLATCPGGVSPCQDPEITVSGNLLYAPQDLSETNKRINMNEYSFVVDRGVVSRSEPLEVFFSDADGNNQGGGNCVPGWNQRPLNGENVNLIGEHNVALAGNNFTLQPGTYICKVAAQGFEALDGFRIEIRENSGTIGPFPAGGGYSGWGEVAYAHGTVKFSIAEARTFSVWHHCGPASSRGHPGQLDMGIPVPDYSNPTTYTSVSCIKSS